jgi:hypothetical protein
MRDHDVLNLTPADRTAIATWRRRVMTTVALIIVVTLAGTSLHQRYLAPLLETAVASAQSRAPITSRECSLRDAQYLFQLEEHGNRPDADGAQLHRAHLAMLEARTLCDAGRQQEAIALYDRAFGPFVATKEFARTRNPAN